MFLRRVWPSRRDANYWRPAQLLHDFEQLLDFASRSPGDEHMTGVFPALNITRDANSFYVRAELPGVNASELEITTEGAKLSISGSREIAAEGDVSYHRRERASGSFSRTMVLPNDVDGERVAARYVDGILTITLPLAEAAKAKQITVRTD
jgi:HSP20 family protein